MRGSSPGSARHSSSRSSFAPAGAHDRRAARGPAVFACRNRATS
jgi:hypothetical protein